MNSEIDDHNKSQKILENNSLNPNIDNDKNDINNILEIKNEENSTNNKATIEMRKEIKNKKRKDIKIRAYCNKCYQFFENGPYSKICKNHLKKNCTLIECQKYNKNGDNLCIRKFNNINSANRHTHCLTQKDVESWDQRYEIQKCLGKKKEKEIDNKFLEIINNDNNYLNNKNKENNFFSDVNNSLNNNCLFMDNNNSFFDNSSQNYFSNNSNNVIGLIEDIDKLHFNDNEENGDIKHILNKSNWPIKKDSNNCEEKCKDVVNDKVEKEKNFENLSIEEFFERVQQETNIPNNIKKKLVKSFKKKGILNVKILMLFYEKYKNWDFLIQKFKKVTTQIEGVALCIEFLLKKH